MSSLMSAIRSADLALMSELLADAGTDVNGAGHLGTTPLAVAVKTGQLAALRLLLAHPRIDTAMADHFGTHALIWAVKAGDTAGVELLLAHDQGSLNAADALGSTPLLWAVKCSRHAVAALLLACRGVDLNAADQYGVSPLICAAKLGDDHMMGLLLAASRSASAGSGCPHAAGSSRGGGAPLDINAADQHGSTALIWAARMGSRPCLQLLLGHPGVDANACSDTGLTALHAAAVKDAGLIDNVQLLLQHGASLDAADQHGQTVLCLAVKRSNNQLVQLLWRWQQAQLLQLQAEVAQWRAMPAALAESIALFAGQVPRQQR